MTKDNRTPKLLYRNEFIHHGRGMGRGVDIGSVGVKLGTLKQQWRQADTAEECGVPALYAGNPVMNSIINQDASDL